MTLHSTGRILFLKYTRPVASFHLAVKQPSKKAPLNVLFTGSLETFSDMLLTLHQALSGTGTVFGQPVDSWVIIGRRLTGVAELIEKGMLLNVHIYNKILFPKASEWDPIVARTDRLHHPLKNGALLTAASCWVAELCGAQLGCRTNEALGPTI